jgi:hypothetical protein
MILELHTFANPRLRRFQASENRELPVLEKHASRTLSNPDVSRVTSFPEFPNIHVTPDFTRKIECISYMHQDQVYTHMIDVISEISINNIQNIRRFNKFITTSLLHSDDRHEGF